MVLYRKSRDPKRLARVKEQWTCGSVIRKVETKEEAGEEKRERESRIRNEKMMTWVEERGIRRQKTKELCVLTFVLQLSWAKSQGQQGQL